MQIVLELFHGANAVAANQEKIIKQTGLTAALLQRISVLSPMVCSKLQMHDARIRMPEDDLAAALTSLTAKTQAVSCFKGEISKALTLEQAAGLLSEHLEKDANNSISVALTRQSDPKEELDPGAPIGLTFSLSNAQHASLGSVRVPLALKFDGVMKHAV